MIDGEVNVRSEAICTPDLRKATIQSSPRTFQKIRWLKKSATGGKAAGLDVAQCLNPRGMCIHGNFSVSPFTQSHVESGR